MCHHALVDEDRGEVYLPGDSGYGCGARFRGCPNCPGYADCVPGPGADGCPGCPGFEDFPGCPNCAGGPAAAECADCAPMDCARWKTSDYACPACLEFAERAYPRPRFAEAALLLRDDGPFLCPDCGETYTDLEDLALRALENLKDALDDQNWLAEQLAAAQGPGPREILEAD